MKSGGPWNLRGLRPEAREAAREAARRSGMSVGEWLNAVIRPEDEDDSDWSADFDREFDREPEERWSPRRRRDEREREPYRGVERRRREREPDDPGRQSFARGDRGPEQYRETDWRRHDRSRDDERPMRREDGPYREEYRSSGNPYYEEPNRCEEPRREEPRREEPRRERASRPRGEREQRSQYQDEADVRRPRYEPPVFVTRDEPPPESPRIERAPPWPPENDRDEFVDQAVAEITARQRALDRSPRANPPRGQPPLETDVPAETTAARRPVHYAAADIAAPQRAIAADFAVKSKAVQIPPDDEMTAQITARQRTTARDVGIESKAAQIPPDDDLTAQITARRRTVAGDVGVESKAAQIPPDDEMTAQMAQIATRQRTIARDLGIESKAAQIPPDDDLTAQITARQRALAGETVETFSQREPLPLSSLPPESRPASEEHPQSEEASAQGINLSGLEQQLRQITMRIEALRPSAELETAINGLRADLAEIGRSLTEASPQHALESLEIEVKALAQRIDHSRQSGADTAALAGLERGLADVREALRTLTPTESLVGFDEAVRGLASKVDAIAAHDDPATLQQLESAIGALRGIVSHVASNDTLAKVADEVRALAAKIDDFAKSAANGSTLSTLENRIDVLATALNASAEAGHAVPRELEKLLSGLIEKLEWVQLTHTDHTALAHLEDRIATLVKRLDASNSRLGLLEGVERGLADLLVHMDHLRGVTSERDGLVGKPPVSDVIEQEVVRTQDSLEAVQGTVEHVVDRLAMIESDIRVDRARTALTEEPSPPVEVQEPPPPTPPPPPPPALERLATLAPAEVSSASYDLPAEPSYEAAKPVEPEVASRRLAVARAPIDPSLPPDHPLEPGFTTAGRSRSQLSAAVRIAASEAVIELQAARDSGPGWRQIRFHCGCSARRAGGGLSHAAAEVERRLRRFCTAEEDDRPSAHLDGSSSGCRHCRRWLPYRLALSGGRRFGISAACAEGCARCPNTPAGTANRTAWAARVCASGYNAAARRDGDAATAREHGARFNSRQSAARSDAATGRRLGAAFRRVASARRRPEPNAANSGHTPVSVGFEVLAAEGTGRRVAYRFSAMGRG